jgi:Putative transposase
VTVIQRFGSGLQLNVHGHALVLDGVFTEAADGTLRFHPAPPPTDVEVARLVATIRTRVLRLLRRRGIFTEAADDDAPDPLAETSLALAGITSAAVQGRSAMGLTGPEAHGAHIRARPSASRLGRAPAPQVLDDTCQSGGSGFGTMTDPRSVSTHLVTDLSRTLPTPSGRPEGAASLLPSARLPAVAPAL